MKRSKLAAMILSATAFLGTGRAQAALYDFTFDGSDGATSYVVQGLLTTASTINQFGGYDVTSIVGSVDGSGIIGPDPSTTSTTGYAPLYEDAAGFIYDNSLSPTAPYPIDGAGLAFRTASADYNLGYYGDGSYYLFGLPDGSSDMSSAVGTLTLASVSAAPEAATWTMLILGFGLIGGVLRAAYRRSEDGFTRKVRALATG